MDIVAEFRKNEQPKFWEEFKSKEIDYLGDIYENKIYV